MRSLFVRIFIYFLLMIMLSGIIGIILTYSRDHEFPPIGHKHFAKQALREYGRTAVETYEQGGVVALRNYAEELSESAGVNVFLFSRRGESLTPALVPQRIGTIIKRMARRAFMTEQMVFSERKELPWMASPLVSESGNTYVIVVGLPERPPLRHIFKALPPALFGSRTLVILAVAALLCFILARSLTSPIRKLRRATHQFANGDLTTRIGAQVAGKGELSDLGKDFDFMAARIETLITAQKRLLQDISHELRSPLARISVALELARQRSGDEAQSALDRIEMESAQLNEMIGQLLNLTQLESGMESHRMESLRLDELVADVVGDAEFESRGTGKAVRLSACPPVTIKGPGELLRRAVENVVRNALKYTPQGTAVDISLQLDRNTGQATIRVRDQGPGVPDSALGKIFEPFFRVEDARDRGSGGTGIGLAIAERAIKLTGGSIRAANMAVGGLEIVICLPVADEKHLE